MKTECPDCLSEHEIEPCRRDATDCDCCRAILESLAVQEKYASSETMIKAARPPVGPRRPCLTQPIHANERDGLMNIIDAPEIEIYPPCCSSSGYRGPEHCTCWEPVYDREQVKPIPGGEVETRPLMCSTCAFRPASPERQGDPAAAFADDLDELVYGRGTFYCHEDMRTVVAWRHPVVGIEIAVDRPDLAFDPPFVRRQGEKVPLKFDGSRADRCAGQAARRRAVGVPELSAS